MVGQNNNISILINTEIVRFKSCDFVEALVVSTQHEKEKDIVVLKFPFYTFPFFYYNILNRVFNYKIFLYPH